MRLKLGKRLVSVDRYGIQVATPPGCMTLGVTNELEDCSYFLAVDYDNVDYDVVLKDIRHVHEVFGLCSFITFTHSSSMRMDANGEVHENGNYAVVGYDKLTYLECWRVMTHMRMDRLHRKIGGLYEKRNWAIRMTGKFELVDGKLVEYRPEPQVRDILTFRGHCRYRHSGAVASFLDEWFGIRLPYLKCVNDGNIEFKKYNMTRKRK